MSTSKSKSLSLIFPLIILISNISYNVSAHNVTEILDSEPTLSEFNDYLTQTKLVDEINYRSTITILALTNSAMSSLPSNLSTAAVKNILSLHILLDYYGDIKLHDIANNTSVTTLYQSTGVAEEQIGRLNIIQRPKGAVEFVSAQPGSGPGPKYVKEIRTIPFNISILQITSPIIVPTLMTSGPPDNKTSANVTDVLLNAGFKTFTQLITSTGVIKSYITQMSTEITIFAPTDVAFKAKGMPDVKNLSSAEIVSLLQFHALDIYAPLETLKSSKTELKTLAPAGKFDLTVSSTGDELTLHTGVVDAKIASTLVDDGSQVAIYGVDRVLLPEELYGGVKVPTAAPAPESEAPKKAPTKAPEKAPYASPPAPPKDESPAKSPSSGGGGEDDNIDGGAPESPADGGDEKNGGVTRNVSLLMAVVVLVISIVV